MGTKRALEEVDPLCLPVGTRVGPWRVEAWRGRGAYGTLYRVVREGREQAGPFALKLAIYPRDERFEREAWLLARVNSLHVPRLEEQGVWEHPRGAFPYVVMEWIEGEPLYDWAARRNPSSRQVLRLLAHGARALEATHAVGGVHRDVKGDNFLVRLGDGRAVLTDFGAGYYRGAVTLTTRLLPPGTPRYRSPEAWAFLGAFLRHPTAHYPASACDDLFALGVIAWRLVTDEYPPSTHPEDPGSEVWREGGPGLRSPRELNPRVSPELAALILRLLSVAPMERFEGKAGEAARALEQAAEGGGPDADVELFAWGDEYRRRIRTQRSARSAAEQDAAERAPLSLPRAEKPPQDEVSRGSAKPRASVSVWGGETAVAVLGLLVAGLFVAWLYPRGEAARVSSNTIHSEQGAAAVGDNASGPRHPALPSVSAGTTKPGIGRPLPDKPLDSQRTPPCNEDGDVEINGACWYELARATAPCRREDSFEWKGGCYMASLKPRRPGTSQQP